MVTEANLLNKSPDQAPTSQAMEAKISPLVGYGTYTDSMCFKQEATGATGYTYSPKAQIRHATNTSGCKCYNPKPYRPYTLKLKPTHWLQYSSFCWFI